MDQVIQTVTYLALLSVAAERFTDIIKRLVLSKYMVNGAVYQLIAAGFWLLCRFGRQPSVLSS